MHTLPHGERTVSIANLAHPGEMRPPPVAEKSNEAAGESAAGRVVVDAGRSDGDSGPSRRVRISSQRRR
jgi:hypothetical protein